MIKRSLKKNVLKSLRHFPIVGILGSRQVGKTTLAKEILTLFSRAVYLDLELPSDLNKLMEPELYLTQHSDSLVIIDEIQRMPSLFPLLRALVDQHRVPGRFLILGSASPDLIRKSSETLAGRIKYHELTPFTQQETGAEPGAVNKLWLYGGYPDSFLSASLDLSIQWREAFIRTYLERDIPQLGFRIPVTQLRRFWTMLAHFSGQVWNASKIASSLGVSAPTVRHYLDILQDTFIIRQLPPYHINIKKRLVKSPKMYLRDSGLLHTLLKIKTSEDLYSHPSLGSSWEGFVIEQITSNLPESIETYFFRTIAGAEIDLIAFEKPSKIIAIEIKYSTSPKISRGFNVAFNDLSCCEGFVIYPGDETYPLSDNVTALPVSRISEISNSF